MVAEFPDKRHTGPIGVGPSKYGGVQPIQLAFSFPDPDCKHGRGEGTLLISLCGVDLWEPTNYVDLVRNPQASGSMNCPDCIKKWNSLLAKKKAEKPQAQILTHVLGENSAFMLCGARLADVAKYVDLTTHPGDFGSVTCLECMKVRAEGRSEE